MTGPDDTTPATAPAPGAPRKAPGWMRALLLASLALNLAVVGIVAGSFLGRAGPDGGPRTRDGATALYLRALPDDQRAAFDEGLRHAGPHFRPDRAAMRAEFDATLQALRADPFDATAFAERIARQRRALAERISAGDGLLVERLAAMTPAERGAYADRLERIVARFGRPRGD